MSENGPSRSYAFGDSAPAATRLALVARVFAASTRALLARAGEPSCRRALDLGCGPGHTTHLLAEAFPHAAVVGLDQSAAFLAAARASAVPRTSFAEADVTRALLPHAPADLVYARFVLSHLHEREAALRAWLGALAPHGRLVVEDVERIDTTDEVFRAYLAITTGLMASRGGTLYLGPELAAATRGLDGVIAREATLTTVVPATRDVATMFGLNLQAWRHDPWVTARHDDQTLDAMAAALRARQDAPGDQAIRWTLRQVVVERA